jgi:hypothetical protein
MGSDPSFSRKRIKKHCSASQKTGFYPKLGEADPGGLGACPQEVISPIDAMVYVLDYSLMCQRLEEFGEGNGVKQWLDADYEAVRWLVSWT